MTTVPRFAGALLVICAAHVAAERLPGQDPATSVASGSGLIVGRTVDLTTGTAIGGAIISLIGGPPAAAAGQLLPATLSRFPLRVMSDSGGRFVFHDLPKGAYTINAAKPGYADTSFGRRTPADSSGQSLVLADGERRGDVTLVLWKFASISGIVFDEANEPLIGVQVRVFKRAMVAGKARFTEFGNMPVTDDRGVYRTTSLLPGDYVVGIVTTQATVPTSLQVAMAASAQSGAADLQRDLERSSGLSAFQNAFSAGQRLGSWLLETPVGFGSQGQLAGPPVVGDRVFVYPTTFYPSAPALTKATMVTVGSGEERSGVDLQLKPMVTSRVSGTLTGPNGPEPFTALNLLPAGTDDLQRDYDFATASAVTDAAGAFVFLGVPQGSYILRSLKIPPRPVTPSTMTTVIQTGTSMISSGGGPSLPAPIPDEPTFWAIAPVSVGETDVTGVGVVLRAGARLGGRLEFDGAAQKPAADRLPTIAVQAESADGRAISSNQFTLSRGVVDATGQFKTYQLPPGRYLVRVPGTVPGWTFKGASLNGRDITDAPLDLGGEDIGDIVVTFTDTPSDLSGAVRTGQGQDPAATVLAFPVQLTLWVDYGSAPRRLRSVRAGSDGSYHIPNLPAGDYFVAAIHSNVPADWQDVKYLQKVSALATRVTIVDGEKKSLDVQSKEVR
jgi:hypothetical protein